MPGSSKGLFATHLYQGSLSGSAALNRRLMQDVNAFSAEDKMGKDWSRENYRGGYTSYSSLSDMHHRSPAFMDFATAIEKEANSFAKDLKWEMRGMELVMTACWFNIMPKNTYHTSHLHPHSVISGAYYVETPPGSIALKIEDPRMQSFMNAPMKKSSAEGLYYQVQPKAGSFVLFESWVRHEVPPNTSTKPRISISFNFSLEARSL
jgi:uncharacterized protein (TIGR02466 family)